MQAAPVGERYTAKLVVDLPHQYRESSSPAFLFIAYNGTVILVIEIRQRITTDIMADNGCLGKVRNLLLRSEMG